MYPSGYTQDTSRYIRIRILITNPPKLDNKPPLTPGGTVMGPVMGMCGASRGYTWGAHKRTAPRHRGEF